MLDPHVESRPWDEQLALDDEAYRVQLAYLLERSPFYREKLELSSAEEAGGLDEIARLPLTEKTELKATTTHENPVGAHLCVSGHVEGLQVGGQLCCGKPRSMPRPASPPRVAGSIQRAVIAFSRVKKSNPCAP